jgi:cytochrome c5
VTGVSVPTTCQAGTRWCPLSLPGARFFGMNARVDHILNEALALAAEAILPGIALATGLALLHSTDSTAAPAKAAGGPVRPWVKLSVELPASQIIFPPSDGADIANAQCLICHSAGYFGS